jgi:hypothetical protein
VAVRTVSLSPMKEGFMPQVFSQAFLDSHHWFFFLSFFSFLSFHFLFFFSFLFFLSFSFLFFFFSFLFFPALIVNSLGSNEQGQLGLKLSGDGNSASFQRVPFPVHVVTATCGFAHTMLLDNMGKLFAAGANTVGQLGIPIEQVMSSTSGHGRTPAGFHEVPFDREVIALASGLRHNLILSKERYVCLSTILLCSDCLGRHMAVDLIKTDNWDEKIDIISIPLPKLTLAAKLPRSVVVAVSPCC